MSGHTAVSELFVKVQTLCSTKETAHFASSWLPKPQLAETD
jgi:hypothetical protein